MTVNILPLFDFYAEFPFGLIQGIIKGFVPRVSSLSVCTDMEQVIAGRAFVMSDFERRERRKGPQSMSIRNRVFGPAGVQMMWGKFHPFYANQLGQLGIHGQCTVKNSTRQDSQKKR